MPSQSASGVNEWVSLDTDNPWSAVRSGQTSRATVIDRLNEEADRYRRTEVGKSFLSDGILAYATGGMSIGYQIAARGAIATGKGIWDGESTSDSLSTYGISEFLGIVSQYFTKSPGISFMTGWAVGESMSDSGVGSEREKALQNMMWDIERAKWNRNQHSWIEPRERAIREINEMLDYMHSQSGGY